MGWHCELERAPTRLSRLTHYHPSGKPESDQSSVALILTEHPQRGLAYMAVGTRLIDLPPGDAHHVVTDWIEVPTGAAIQS
jgi:hypothetical protein